MKNAPEQPNAVQSSSRTIGTFILGLALTSGIVAASLHFRVGYWMSPPKEKFIRAWNDDIQLLEQSGKLPKQWAEIKSVEIKTDNSTALRDWLADLNAPVRSNPNGRFKLESYLVHQIDGYRYSVMIEYTLVDLVTNDTVSQFGRTLKLGFVY